MHARYVQSGDMVDYTPTSDVAAGNVVIQGDMVGVSKLDIKAGTLGSIALKGIFEVPKATGTGSAILIGTKVYWDVAEAVVKADSESGANKLFGIVVRDSSDSDGIVRVKLNA